MKLSVRCVAIEAEADDPGAFEELVGAAFAEVRTAMANQQSLKATIHRKGGDARIEVHQK